MDLENLIQSQGKCLVCGDVLDHDVVTCGSCSTPTHGKCRDYAGGCPVYGCKYTPKALTKILETSDIENQSKVHKNYWSNIWESIKKKISFVNPFNYHPNKEIILKTEYGSLIELVPKFERGTWLTSAELTNERRTNEKIKDTWFYTANFGLYCVENNKAVLYFGGKEDNPIFNNIDIACIQLTENKNYIPSAKQAELAKKNALRLELEELGLHSCGCRNEEIVCFGIYTTKYNLLNKSQRALAEAVYGKADEFLQNMKMFAQENVQFLSICLLRKNYVLQNAYEHPIMRTGWLYGFSYSSSFSIYEHNVKGRYAMRGMARNKFSFSA